MSKKLKEKQQRRLAEEARRARARKEHRTVRAFGLSEHYRQIFAITRLSDFMGIYADEDSAVTAASEPAISDAYAEASTPTTKGIVLNFSGLEYMNSGGIGMLVTLLVRANRQRQRLLAFGLNQHYRQIFELTRLDEAIGIHDSEAAALADAER